MDKFIRPLKHFNTRRLLLGGLLLGMLSACSSDAPETTSTQATQGIYTGSISRNGQFSVIGSINHGGSLWNLKTQQRVYDWNHKSGDYSDFVATALSHDGAIAVTADRRRFVFWDTATGESIGFWAAPAQVRDVSLSGDGRFALIGLNDYSALYIDVNEGQILNKFHHQGAIETVSISADGTLGITGSVDRTAILWDLAANKELHQWQFNNTVNLVAISAMGDRAMLSSQHEKFQVWDIKQQKSLIDHANRSATITAATFIPGQDAILIGNSLQQIEQWDLTNNNKTKRWQLPGKNMWRPARAKIYSIGISENAQRFYSITSEGVVQEWQL